MSLTSDEVNFLVYRYLLEAGTWGGFGLCGLAGSSDGRRQQRWCFLAAARLAFRRRAPAATWLTTLCVALLLNVHPSAGFTHAAFVFGAESNVAKSGISGKEVPVGALVSFVQKARRSGICGGCDGRSRGVGGRCRGCRGRGQ